MHHASDIDPIGAVFYNEHSYTEHMYNTLNEFSGMYPIHIMKSIEYYRPSVAMIISVDAANGGGALVFTTKDGADMKEWDANLFIRDFNFLGYQDEPKCYEPHFIYDPTSEDAVFNAAWVPCVQAMTELPDQGDSFIQIEGIADGFVPVLIRGCFE